MSCSKIPPLSPFISPEYLADIHNMEINEAKTYFLFCIKKTIRYKQCYGDGSIMLPLWKKEMRIASGVVKNLMNDL